MNAPTRKPTIEATIEGNTLTLNFDNGEVITIHATAMTEEMQRMAMMHGLKQKLVDAAAISRNPDTGRSATTEDKFQAVGEVYDRLMAGQWNKGRAEGEGSGTGGLLFRALCNLYTTKTPEAIREFLSTKSKEEQAALRVTPRVAAEIERIKATSPKVAKIDADALLDGLND